MPIPDLPSISQQADQNGVIQYLQMLRRRLNDFLGHLDTLNVDELDAKVVKANTITADKMNVTQLSAIAADLGTIIAGTIYGTYIATTQGAYPRVELSNTDNLLKAEISATQSASIEAFGYTDLPSIKWQDGSDTAYALIYAGLWQLVTVLGVAINSGQHIELNTGGSGYKVKVADWSYLYNKATGHDLQTDLNSKANAFSGYTGTVSTGTQTLTYSNGILVSVS